MAKFSDLLGKTLKNINIPNKEKIHFYTTCDKYYLMYHKQDCCESVTIEDICGDIADLIGNPILSAYESTSEGDDEIYDSSTWTFYVLSTVKGSVTIRWFGGSNGYYSETVDFEERKKL